MQIRINNLNMDDLRYMYLDKFLKITVATEDSLSFFEGSPDSIGESNQILPSTDDII